MRVKDIFDVRYGHSLELNRLEVSTAPDAVAFVSRTARNNGVSATVKPIEGLQPAPAGTISVSLGGRNYTLETSLQVNPFYTGRDVSYLVPRKEMDTAEKLWWAMCIRANRYRYSYGRQANRTLADLVLPDRVPSWVRTAKLPEFAQIRTQADTPELNTHLWERFSFDQVFILHRGERYLARDLTPGNTPYIRATARENGVTARVDLPPMFPAGLITVASNGSVGEAFYQPEPFVASDDVTVLQPKSSLSMSTIFFLCVLIRAEQYRFNYGRKWFTERMRSSILNLPVDSAGNPDWNFAEKYVKSLPVAALALDTDSL